MPRKRAKERQPDAQDAAFDAEEVCRREITGAINLLALTSNYPAAHLLASAAHSNMRTIARNEGVELVNDLATWIRTWDASREAEMMGYLLRPYNTLKHLRNKGSSAFFRLQYVEISILLACNDFKVLFDSLTPEMIVYNFWSVHRFPEFFKLVGTKPMKEFDGADSDDVETRLRPLRSFVQEVCNDPVLWSKIDTGAVKLTF